MAEMGRYCKAYLGKDLRAFPGWDEGAGREVGEDDILYVQENLVVTGGIFKDEDVVFDRVTPEWTEFCTHTLAFEIPDYAREDEAPSTP